MATELKNYVTNCNSTVTERDLVYRSRPQELGYCAVTSNSKAEGLHPYSIYFCTTYSRRPENQHLDIDRVSHLRTWLLSSLASKRSRCCRCTAFQSPPPNQSMQPAAGGKGFARRQKRITVFLHDSLTATGTTIYGHIAKENHHSDTLQCRLLHGYLVFIVFAIHAAQWPRSVLNNHTIINRCQAPRSHVG